MPTRYEAIKCTDYINGHFWDDYSEVERQNALSALENELQLCPNISTYSLNGGLRSKDSTFFSFEVTENPDFSGSEAEMNEYIKGTIVYTEMLSRYFEP